MRPLWRCNHRGRDMSLNSAALVVHDDDVVADRLRAVVRRAAIPTVLLELPDARIAEVSATVPGVLGTSRTSLMDRGADEYVSDGWAREVVGLVNDGRLSGFSFDYRLRRQDGGESAVFMWARAVDSESSRWLVVIL